MAVDTDIIQDHQLKDSLRSALALVQLFDGIATDAFDDWPLTDKALDRLDVARTDARNALDALGGPLARTIYIRAAEAGE
jgi:hypothetical protein